MHNDYKPGFPKDSKFSCFLKPDNSCSSDVNLNGHWFELKRFNVFLMAPYALKIAVDFTNGDKRFRKGQSSLSYETSQFRLRGIQKQITNYAFFDQLFLHSKFTQHYLV